MRTYTLPRLMMVVSIQMKSTHELVAVWIGRRVGLRCGINCANDEYDEDDGNTNA